MDFNLREAAKTYLYQPPIEPDDADTNHVEDAFFAGALAMLEGISQLFEKLKITGESTKERDAFYAFYNRENPNKQRETQTVTVGRRRFQAEWVSDPYNEQSILGCFWSSTSANLNAHGEWCNYAGGPLQGNPQTEREAQLMLLQMATW